MSDMRKSTGISGLRLWAQQRDARAQTLLLLIFFVFAFHARSVYAIGLVVVGACVWAMFARIRIADVARAFFPLMGIAVFTLITQVIVAQYGEHILELSIFGHELFVTDEGLFKALRMIVVLIGVLVASISFMRITPLNQLMHVLSWVLTPLQKWGVRTRGFMLALRVAIYFIPALVREFHMQRISHVSRAALSAQHGTIATLRMYIHIVPPLIRNSFRHADALAHAYVSRCF